MLFPNDGNMDKIKVYLKEAHQWQQSGAGIE